MYNEFITFLIKQAKTHDLYTPFKRPTCHAHQATSESFYNDEMNVADDDTESAFGEFLAHMSLSNEPINKDIKKTMQAYATFQKRRGPPRVRPESKGIVNVLDFFFPNLVYIFDIIWLILYFDFTTGITVLQCRIDLILILLFIRFDVMGTNSQPKNAYYVGSAVLS